MFCHITANWRGRPLVGRQVVVNLIGNTATATGLRIQAAIDDDGGSDGIIREDRLGLDTIYTMDYASRIATTAALIDGQVLANLMIDFDVGVSVSPSYHVKRIDSDYFEEGEPGP